MQTEDQRSILAIALHAAFADGVKDDREREEVRRIAESLASASDGIDLRGLYQDVLLKRLGLEQAVAGLLAAHAAHGRMAGERGSNGPMQHHVQAPCNTMHAQRMG